MVKTKDAPQGATITKTEGVNEFKEREAQGKKQTSLDDFLLAMQEQERVQMKPTSVDMEVLKDVTPKMLNELQGLDVKGRPTGQAPRLRGWDPKTKTALVLKHAFIEKAKANKEK